MRKKLIVSLIVGIICISLIGCSTRDQELLAFDSNSASQELAFDHHITQADFFAKNLVTVSEADNAGGDAVLSSGASLLVNVTDKELIYADHVYDRLYPASLTKLMTALVVLNSGELTDSVTISENASHITESGAKLCGFKEGDVLSLEALLNCLLIYSGNDAAVAIAEHVGGSVDTFVGMMNKEAKEIGAVHTNFVNPNGLHDDNQYTTAYDIYLIFNELLQYDTFRSIIHNSSYTVEYKNQEGIAQEKTFSSTNQYLLGEAELPDQLQVIGGKTGTTNKAGNCLIILSKDSKEKEYVSVILKAEGSTELYSQMSYLLSLIQ